MREDVNEILKETVKPVIRIELFGEPEIGKSRTIGEVDQNGDLIVAEISLVEVPRNGLLPRSGFLRFYIRNNHDYGLSEKHFSGGNCKVLHTKTPYPGGGDKEQEPIIRPLGMRFTLDKEEVTLEDDLIREHLTLLEIDELADSGRINLGEGHKLLGYPYYTQAEPRYRYPEYDTLLFQLDTDRDEKDVFTVRWGDCGVANFFINKEALLRKDFSDVLFNWDCF